MWRLWRRCLGLLLLRMVVIRSTAEEGPDVRHDFQVLIREAGSLGAALSGSLRVERLVRDPKSGEPSRLEARGVEVGDLLVAVNAVPVEGMSPKDVRTLLTSQARPLRLIFRPHDGRPRVIPGMNAPEAPMSEDDIKAEGHLDVLEGPISLFSVPVTRAKFGGYAACGRRRIVPADPPDACTDLRNKVAGFYVLVERGNCSFAVKALTLGREGAVGMILVNGGEGGRYRMSGEDVESRMGKGFEAPVSVMISKHDGDQLQQALRAHWGHVYGRLVVTEECFRGEDEWHKVHDVAWKDHPHLQKPDPSPLPRAVRPVVSAKGIRVTPQGATVDPLAAEGSTEAKGAKRRRESGHVEVQDWDRSQGALGRQAAEWRVRTERANEARGRQSLRSGVIQLRSENLTWIWEKGVWSDHDQESVARVAAGPVVARADFLPAKFGGPISLGKRAIVASLPINDCSHLDPPLPEQAIWVVSLAETTCGLAAVIRLAQQAHASLVAITETGYHEPRPRVLQKEALDREAQSLVESSLWVPVVELCEDEGRHLLGHVRDPQAMVQAEVLDRPETAELWAILDKLQDPSGWPDDAAQQRRLFQHLKQRHDPEASGGSVGRYKYLLQGYERVVGPGQGGLGAMQI